MKVSSVFIPIVMAMAMSFVAPTVRASRSVDTYPLKPTYSPEHSIPFNQSIGHVDRTWASEFSTPGCKCPETPFYTRYYQAKAVLRGFFYRVDVPSWADPKKPPSYLHYTFWSKVNYRQTKGFKHLGHYVFQVEKDENDCGQELRLNNDYVLFIDYADEYPRKIIKVNRCMGLCRDYDIPGSYRYFLRKESEALPTPSPSSRPWPSRKPGQTFGPAKRSSRPTRTPRHTRRPRPTRPPRRSRAPRPSRLPPSVPDKVF